MVSKYWLGALIMAPLAVSAGPLTAKTPVAQTAVSKPPPAKTTGIKVVAAPAATGWMKIDLLKDENAPDNPIPHKDLDIVSAIWFRDLKHGLIGTMEGENHSGGVIYTAAGPKLTGIAFRGYHQAIDDHQDVVFRDFMPTPTGVIALLDRSDTYIHSDNNFKFTREAPGGQFGVESQLWMAPTTAGKWFLVTGTGVVYNASEEPGKGVEWNTIWFPEGHPPVPDPVPEGMCPEAPIPHTPKTRPFRYVFVSPDGQTIAYPLHSKPSVCLSVDGGKVWKEKPLPNAPDNVNLGPHGIYFTDKMHGWTYYANDLEDSSAYVYYTTDGGETWTAGKLPANITAAGSSAGLLSIFFAPDNKWGWLVGYSGDHTTPTILRTSDGGATWTDKSTGNGGLSTVIKEPMKLYSGFALDKDHIWVGGDDGGLFYCNTASQ